MPDPLTLQVMSQIARKSGNAPAESGCKSSGCRPAAKPQASSDMHLTEGQRVMLSQLIQKKQSANSGSGTSPARAEAPKAGRVSLTEAVQRVKSR